ncbi:MAG: Fic family protein [Gammaproteobacteria bacterium]
MTDRYDISNSSESLWQPGSNEKVLLNRLAIVNTEDMENLEFDLLLRLQNQLLNEIEIDSRIQSDDLCQWHQRWLGEVYEWAGRYRSVNLSIGDFQFAAAYRIHDLMAQFDRDIIGSYTPCGSFSDAELIDAISITHVELIVIHPFRDGNGRLARLLATVMALQANKPLLNFEMMASDKKRYIGAIHAGHDRNYEPMRQIFGEILEYSLAENRDF